MAMGAAGGGLRSLPDVPLDFGDGGKVFVDHSLLDDPFNKLLKVARGIGNALRVVLRRRRVCTV